MNLELGMKIEGWPPENIEDIEESLMTLINLQERYETQYFWKKAKSKNKS